MGFLWQHFNSGPIINLKQSKLNMLNMEMHNHSRINQSAGRWRETENASEAAKDWNL